MLASHLTPEHFGYLNLRRYVPSKSKAVVLNRMECQMEEFKCLGVLLLNDGRMEQDMDQSIGEHSQGNVRMSSGLYAL